MKNILIVLIFIFNMTLLAANTELGLTVPGVKIDKHLYKTTAKIYQVIKFFRKKGLVSYSKESFETPKVSVTHLKSLKSKTKWEGINIYRYKKLTYIYIIPRDKK